MEVRWTGDHIEMQKKKKKKQQGKSGSLWGSAIPKLPPVGETSDNRLLLGKNINQTTLKWECVHSSGAEIL